jgi:hypothetical protein
MSLPRDIRAFLARYPGQEDDPGASDNLLFYQNRLRCEPDYLLISEILLKYGPIVQSLHRAELTYRKTPQLAEKLQPVGVQSWIHTMAVSRATSKVVTVDYLIVRLCAQIPHPGERNEL